VSKTFAGNITELLVFEVNRLEEEWKQRARTYERKSLEAFQKKCGMKAMELPAKDKKKIEQAFEKVRKKMAGKAYPEKLMNDVLQALKQYRKNH